MRASRLLPVPELGQTAKPPRRDHLERRFFIHMDDVVEAGSSGSELGKARRAREAELVRHGVRAARQIDQDPEPRMREQRPRDGNGLAACVNLWARGHDEDSAWRVLFGEKLKVVENLIERGERRRGGGIAIGMFGRRRAVRLGLLGGSLASKGRSLLQIAAKIVGRRP